MPLYNGGRIGLNNKPFTGTKSDDPNYSNVSLLLNGNGTNGSTTFTDSSSYGHTVTPNGNAQISTVQSKFGGASMYFYGGYVRATDSSEFAFGTGDFTVEAWIRGTGTFFETRTGLYDAGFGYAISGSNNITIWDGQAVGNVYNGSNTYDWTNWHHVAISRSGTTLRVFVDGSLDGTATTSRDLTAQGGIVGANINKAVNASGAGVFSGYIDDLRITKGVARYTSNFTPPTAEIPDPINPGDVSLLLHGNGTNGSTTFTDSSGYAHPVTANGDAQISTAQSKFGGASMYFDGSGDYLTIPSSNSFNFGSGDFTIEAWIYLTSYPVAYLGQYYIASIITKDSSSSGRSFTFNLSGTSTSWTSISVTLFSSNSTFIDTSATTSFNLNTWYHVAAVRNGSSLRLYKDGVDVGGGTNATFVQNTTTVVAVGSESPYYISIGYAYYFPGYIDDLCITKGVAKYTSLPTAQLPGGETGTIASGLWTLEEHSVAIRKELWPGLTPPIVTDGLVLNLDAGDTNSYPGSGTTWFDLSGQGNNGTINGATYSSSDGGSIVFDGVNDYVSFTSTSLNLFPVSFSFWATAGGEVINKYTPSSFNGYRISLTTSGINAFYFRSNSSYTNNYGNNYGNISANTFYHVVVVVDNSGIKFYVNSQLVGSNGWVGTPGAITTTEPFKLGFYEQYRTGNIAQVSVYNKALTPSEITQNFNALKGRYGL